MHVNYGMGAVGDFGDDSSTNLWILALAAGALLFMSKYNNEQIGRTIKRFIPFLK